MKNIIASALILILILSAAGCGMSKKLTDEQKALKGQYPEYFDINPSGGLDVIVWQMAEKSYSFALLKHSSKERNRFSDEFLNLKGVNAEDMKTILSAYNIDKNNIHVIPWQNPFSSYLPDYCIRLENDTDETMEHHYLDYIDRIEEMLDISKFPTQ